VCLAVPVVDPHGRVCAAVAVHGPAPRMTLRKGYGFLPSMRRAAAAIAATLAPAAGAAPTRSLRRVV
jgi:DNA-binding IclR family transcriptional regulator